MSTLLLHMQHDLALALAQVHPMILVTVIVSHAPSGLLQFTAQLFLSKAQTMAARASIAELPFFLAVSHHGVLSSLATTQYCSKAAHDCLTVTQHSTHTPYIF